MLVQANFLNPLDDSIYPNNSTEYPSVSSSRSSVSPSLNSVPEYEIFKGHPILSDESDLITPEHEGSELLPAIRLNPKGTLSKEGFKELSIENMEFSGIEALEDTHSSIQTRTKDQSFSLSFKFNENSRLTRRKFEVLNRDSEKDEHSKSKEDSEFFGFKPESQRPPQTSIDTDNKDSRVTEKDAFYIPWGSERDRLGCAPLYPQPLKSKTPLPSGFSLLSKNLRESLSSLTNVSAFLKPVLPLDTNGAGSSSEDQPPGGELYGCSFPNCNKTFNCIYNLRSHYKIHTSDRPFKCDVCDQSFSRNHDLKRHQKIHLGYKPYRCSICDRTFGRLDALKRHVSVRRCAERKAKSLVRK